MAVQLVDTKATSPGHGLEIDGCVIRTLRVEHLVILVLHRVELQMAAVDEVGPFAKAEVIKRWLVLELANTAHTDLSNAHVGFAFVDEALLGIDTLLRNLGFEGIIEVRATENRV